MAVAQPATAVERGDGGVIHTRLNKNSSIAAAVAVSFAAAAGGVVGRAADRGAEGEEGEIPGRPDTASRRPRSRSRRHRNNYKGTTATTHSQRGNGKPRSHSQLGSRLGSNFGCVPPKPEAEQRICSSVPQLTPSPRQIRNSAQGQLGHKGRGGRRRGVVTFSSSSEALLSLSLPPSSHIISYRFYAVAPPWFYTNQPAS